MRGTGGDRGVRPDAGEVLLRVCPGLENQVGISERPRPSPTIMSIMSERDSRISAYDGGPKGAEGAGLPEAGTTSLVQVPAPTPLLPQFDQRRLIVSPQ